MGKITDPFAQAALHGVAGCITSVASGSKCGPGALAASVSKFATVSGFKFDGYAGAISSAIVGGTASVIGGGKFANGAVTAAAGYLFNCLAHGCNMKSEGYDSTYYKREGIICNGPGDPSCRFPGAGGESGGANVSGGSEVTGMLGFVGVSLSATKAIDTNQNVCAVIQGCMLVGAGLYFGAEGVTQASTGRLSTGSVGGIGLFGKGGMGPSANVTPIQINFDGSVAGQVGSGVGYGGGAGLKFCQQTTTCPK
jgi:hypothetical protein